MSIQSKQPSQSFPNNIRLQQFKDQAKALLDSGAAKSVTDAQFQIARRFGFLSWPKLKAHFHSVGPSLLRSEPVLPVGDMRRSREWYERILHFKTAYLHNDPPEDLYGNYAELRRDGVIVSLVLCQGPSKAPWSTPGTQNTTIYVHDLAQLHAEVVAKGAIITRQFQKEEWGATAFALQDPDGNQIYLIESARNG